MTFHSKNDFPLKKSERRMLIHRFVLITIGLLYSNSFKLPISTIINERKGFITKISQSRLPLHRLHHPYHPSSSFSYHLQYINQYNKHEYRISTKLYSNPSSSSTTSKTLLSTLSSRPSPTLPKLTFLTGKGGVGKTTTSSSLALLLTTLPPDKNVLIVSTDPAHSVHDCFGLEVRIGQGTKDRRLGGGMERGSR